MNLFDKFEKGEFNKVGSVKLTWQGRNTAFDVVKVNISDLKYNVLNGRIAELDLESKMEVSDAVYEDIKKSILKTSKSAISDLGRNIGKAKLKDPLIVNKDGIIIDGNRRYTAISMLLEGEIKPFTPSDVADLEWVDVIILNEDTETVSMKHLEYSIQFDDMKKDYDPISRAFDFARSHIKLGMSIAEIAESTGIKPSEIEKDIRTVKLIRVYLAALGDKNNISLAIELKLDGPIKEIASNKKNTDYFLTHQKELVNIITISKTQGGDVTRTMRDFVKSSARNGNQNIINSPQVKKEVEKLAADLDVSKTIQVAAAAKTVEQKVKLITKHEHADKVAKSINDLQQKLTSKNQMEEVSKGIDKFLELARKSNFEDVSSIDKAKLAKIVEIING